MKVRPAYLMGPFDANARGIYHIWPTAPIPAAPFPNHVVSLALAASAISRSLCLFHRANLNALNCFSVTPTPNDPGFF
jgi:hypothetical protein